MQSNGDQNGSRMYFIQFNPCGNLETIEHQNIPLQILNFSDESANYVPPLLHTTETEPLAEVSNFNESSDEYDIYVSDSNKQVDDYGSDILKYTTIAPNKQFERYVHIPDTVVQPRAIAVLPKVLQIRRDGISPRRVLHAGIRFGPIQGIQCEISSTSAHTLVSKASTTRTPIFLKSENDVLFHIDTTDKDKSNWFSLLPLGDQNTANVWLVYENNELYGVTVKSIAPRTKLCLGYSKEYAEDHKIPSNQPILDINEVIIQKPRKWWCYECHRGLSTAKLLQRHVDVCHKEVKKSKRRYRCRQCSRIFSNLFTLRRHMTSYCKKEVEKSSTVESNSMKSDVGLNLTLNIEDDRLPSDESFNNYTNGLDFSTNLFDTDRMPNLDISGSSRSETELNPYGPGVKVDNDLINVPDISKMKNDTEEKNNTHIPTEFSCIHCKEMVSNKIKRRHLRECLQRKYACECGQKFLSKDKLAVHIHTEHPIDMNQATPDKKVDDDSTDSYPCRQCNLSFKRRGMLVNHLCRAHGAAPLAARVAAGPLQRRERLFPCPACPKLYRSAAKRQAHVRAHHPGAEVMRAQCIENGKRACEPAACTECPRQYATNAKLLQHIRAHHPLLAPPLRKKSTKSITEQSQPTAKYKVPTF